jgi:multicomponent Na+:H+ antiporter subunit D
MHMQMSPFPVVVPLLAAALLSALSDVLPRRLIDLLACLTSAAVLIVCCILVHVSAQHPIVYWFGGWGPGVSNGFPLGISFVIDPIGAGMAAFVALLVLCALVFAWHYFESVKSLFHAAMLVFLGAMCGLCLTGDLFNLFVWFELMSAAGIMLCGYKSEESGPLQGAINFAVSNTLGAYLTLTGIAILYAQTGALNMARVGAELAAHNPGNVFVLIAFVFFASGFLVKAAAFPFHFWLADAHAVAPTPVCILFSGVMVELGLYAVARVYWALFSQPLEPYRPAIQALFLTIGSFTAVVGGIGCFGQRHLKRLLAFSTISHMGVMIIGFALLNPTALAGAALYVIGHGAVKAALFICAGILLHRFQSVDEFELQGRGRNIKWTGMVMFIGALGLTGLPTFGNFFGESKIEDALDAHRLSGMAGIIMLSGVLTGGAVLRVAARIFLGWGERDEASAGEGGPKIPMDRETGHGGHRTPATMFLPAVLLLGVAVVLVIPATFRSSVEEAAHQFQDVHGYRDLVLNPSAWAKGSFEPTTEKTLPSYWRELISAGVALLAAAWALWPKRIGRVSQMIATALSYLMRPFRAIHSGRIGDYIAWFVFGIAAFGGFLLLCTL